MPDVSVVMGVFDGAAYLEATLRSILDQAGVDLELIVVNDGSADDSARLLEVIAASDRRLRVAHQANTGLTKALIRGCAMAQAPYIARHDCGDTSLPGRLRAQLTALNAHADLAFVSCVTQYVDPSGTFLYRSGGTGYAAQPAAVLDMTQPHGMKDGPSHHGSVMFRRDAYMKVGGYRPEFFFGQDWDLWYRLAAEGNFQMLPETLYRARIGIGDISTTRKPQQETLAALSLESARLRASGRADHAVLKAAAQIRPTPNTPGTKTRAVAAGAYFLGECLRRNGEPVKAAEYFRIALQEQPLHFKARLRLAQCSLRRPVTSERPEP